MEGDTYHVQQRPRTKLDVIVGDKVVQTHAHHASRTILGEATTPCVRWRHRGNDAKSLLDGSQVLETRLLVATATIRVLHRTDDSERSRARWVVQGAET
jgi:hypothetical protein